MQIIIFMNMLQKIIQFIPKLVYLHLIIEIVNYLLNFLLSLFKFQYVLSIYFCWIILICIQMDIPFFLFKPIRQTVLLLKIQVGLQIILKIDCFYVRFEQFSMLYHIQYNDLSMWHSLKIFLTAILFFIYLVLNQINSFSQKIDIHLPKFL